jgi:hypothetical protein
LDDNVSEHRQPFFKNTNKIPNDVSVKFVADLRPVFASFANDPDLVLEDTQDKSIDVTLANLDSLVFEVGVWMNGPATNPTRRAGINDWGGPNGDWGAGLRELAERRLVDDGTNGDDVAGDTLFTVVFVYKVDSSFVSQEFKLGINGGDNEAGFGNNHLYNIDPSQPNQTAYIYFGSIQPQRYPGWDFITNTPTFVVDQIDAVPTEFGLSQNYPNPFNPSTTVPFAVPTAGLVKFQVFNILGQVVESFEFEAGSPGRYELQVDAGNYASGVYFMNMSAGKFNHTIKMILMK